MTIKPVSPKPACIKEFGRVERGNMGAAASLHATPLVLRRLLMQYQWSWARPDK